MGRPGKTLLDIMRTQAWVTDLFRQSGVSTLYQFNAESEYFLTNTSYDFVNGKTTANDKALEKVDEELHRDNSQYPPSDIYRIGPYVDNQHVRLWDALGSLDNAWQTLFDYDWSIELMHQQGEPFETKIYTVIAFLFEYPEWQIKPDYFGDNHVANLYQLGDFKLDIKKFMAIFAAWRLSQFMGESKLLMNYVMIGILHKAVRDLLLPLGIYDTFLKHISTLDHGDYLRLKNAIDKVNTTIQQSANIDAERTNMNHLYSLQRNRVFEFATGLQVKRSKELDLQKKHAITKGGSS